MGATQAVVPTSSTSIPIRAMPNDAPLGALRVIIWHTFTEQGATGTHYTGPWGANHDEWESGGRWEYDGLNLSQFVIGYHGARMNDIDRDFRDLLRHVDAYARSRGWVEPRRRRLPTEQEARDRAIITANGGWNEVGIS